MSAPIRRMLLLWVLASSVSRAQSGGPLSGKPADLSLTAVGRQHHAIQTRNREAQDFFDQGITLLYGFNHEEAARAFQAAAGLDPASPMPLWGIALAVGPNYNLDVDAEREKIAFETIQKAKNLAAAAPAVEQDYVEALAARYSGAGSPDYKALAREYARRMRALSEKYPDDLDAATLYAESLMNLNPWKLWSLEGAPAEQTLEIVRVLESVLSRDPMHAGANHYYIHAVEASRSPERALPSAARLETMVPKAGHLVHMPSHIYSRVGGFSDAARSNAKAIEADRSYAADADKSGSLYDLMYHSHNEHFLAFAAAMQGRYAEAKKAAEVMSGRLAPHAEMMPMLDSFVWTPIWVDLRFARWREILARPEPPSNRKVPHLMWRYSRVVAYASQRDTAKAEAEHAAFAKEAASLPGEAPIGQMNPNDAMLAVAGEVAKAKLDSARGDAPSAIRHWRAAVDAQDKLNYTEPPDWYYPVRESLGSALFAAGKMEEAEAVFREDLARNPRNPRSLFGLQKCLDARHSVNDAAWVERQFREAWKDAEEQLKIEDL